MPTILDLPKPNLLCYSKESAIAEKVEAMVKLGKINSRMKDFYDIWLLSRQFDFKGEDLSKAMTLTFSQRKTDKPESVVFLSPDFAKNKQVQWQAFRNRLNQDFIPESFMDVINHIQTFLDPIIRSINNAVPYKAFWVAPNKWVG